MAYERKIVKEVSRYSLSGILLETYPDTKTAALAMETTQTSISIASKGEKRLQTLKGYIWRRGNAPEVDLKPILDSAKLLHSPLTKKKHNVGQYDLYGNFIASYSNTKLAGKAAGVHYQGVRMAIRGQRYTYGGYVWSNEIKKKVKVHPKVRPDKTVSQYDLDGRLLGTFSNCYNASKETGIDCSHIHRMLTGEVLTAGSYLWRYGSPLRINVNELRRHPLYPGSKLERHLKAKRQAGREEIAKKKPEDKK